jgi:predicted Zn-dependent peptidase
MTRKINFITKALLFAVFIATFLSASAQKNYTYQTVVDDPMHVRIYTLDNGLKVYMTVYKDAPRIQTLIAVKTGSKCDPADNTGLSHYLEHLMFKGTDKYGTLDWAKEKPQLAKIDSMFEVYRKIKDTSLRRKTYHIIDSISGVASKYAIANEYDKMMANIGAKGSNAFTSVESTDYIEDIPSNQLETWATVESERFRNPVFRLFHTELEAVYEEKNIGLDRDDEKVQDSLLSGLFLKHPYGTQTTIGTVEHLKNPSLKAIEAYYKIKYVPNNMAICMSGDFDPDAAIKLIDAKFGSLAYKEVKPFISPVEDPITKPKVKEAIGPDAESVTVGYRFKGAGSDDDDYLQIISNILNNGTAGLIDLNLNQAQKVLQSGCYPDVMKDYSMMVLSGNPKSGQKLEEVKDLLLSQIELIKKGDFPDWLIPAIINDMKLQEIKSRQNNWPRAFAMANSFIEGLSWEDEVKSIDRISKITKQQIIDFANKNFKDNYVVVYKRTGEDNSVKKVPKPAITPVAVNRDSQSEFLKDIISRKPAEINPVFVDYDKDIKKFKIEDSIQVLYNENKEDKTFNLYYVFDMGNNNDKKLANAINYLQFLGTSKLTPAQVQQEFYKAGCSFGVNSTNEQVYVYLSGLSENFEKGIQLFENLLADAQPNQDAIDNMVSNILKQRSDNKLSKDEILWSAMYNFGEFGLKNPYTNILSEKELKSLKPEELVTMIKGLNSYQHYIMYYGTHSTADLSAMLNKYHKVPATLKPVPAEIKFEEQPAPAENKVYVVDYDMKQVEILMLSQSEKFNKSNVSSRRIFNEYFGGGMNSVVFQELRESKALAYTAYSVYSSPSRPDRNHYVYFFIGTQNDKLPEAMKGMFDLINNMPESQKNFDASKEAIIQKIRTERITKENILFAYINAKKMGITYDLRKDVFEQVPNMKISDLLAFDQKYLKDKKFDILVIGKKNEIDTKTLEKYGKIEYLKLNEIFGY